MGTQDSNYIEVRNKIIEGSHLAVKKLIKERKKNKGSLVLFINGEVKTVPAKDL